MTGIPKQRGVLYLDKHTIKIYLYGKQEILSLELPPQIVNDLEIYDAHGLDVLIENFIKQHNIPSTHFLLALS